MDGNQDEKTHSSFINATELVNKAISRLYPEKSKYDLKEVAKQRQKIGKIHIYFVSYKFLV